MLCILSDVSGGPATSARVQVVLYDREGTRAPTVLSSPVEEQQDAIDEHRKVGFHPMSAWLRKGVVPALQFESPDSTAATETTPVRHPHHARDAGLSKNTNLSGFDITDKCSTIS